MDLRLQEIRVENHAKNLKYLDSNLMIDQRYFIAAVAEMSALDLRDINTSHMIEEYSKHLKEYSDLVTSYWSVVTDIQNWETMHLYYTETRVEMIRVADERKEALEKFHAASRDLSRRFVDFLIAREGNNAAINYDGPLAEYA